MFGCLQPTGTKYLLLRNGVKCPRRLECSDQPHLQPPQAPHPLAMGWGPGGLFKLGWALLCLWSRWTCFPDLLARVWPCTVGNLFPGCPHYTHLTFYLQLCLLAVTFAWSLGPCAAFFPVLSGPVDGACWQLLAVPAVLRHRAVLPHHCVPVLGLLLAPTFFSLSALVLPSQMSFLIPQSC